MEFARSRRLPSVELRKLFPKGVPHKELRFVTVAGTTYIFSHPKKEQEGMYDKIISANGTYWGIVKSPKKNELDLIEPIYPL